LGPDGYRPPEVPTEQMIQAKWCPDCEIVWQTRRVTCPRCRRRFAEGDAFTITKGRATRDQAERRNA
jgi:hypothetical protein